MVILTDFLCLCGYVDKFVEKIPKILFLVFTNSIIVIIIANDNKQ